MYGNRIFILFFSGCGVYDDTYMNVYMGERDAIRTHSRQSILQSSHMCECRVGAYL